MSLLRRDFLRQSLAVGSAMSGLGLPGCGEPAPTARASLLGLEGRLFLYAWSDYLAPEVLAGFEREHGVPVVVDTYESAEELLAKLMAGGGGYDLVVPSTYAVQAMIATGLAQPIDRTRLPHWEHLAPTLLDRPFDPGNRHSVPYLWGTTGIAYRSDKIPVAPTSWTVFHDPQWRGRMTMLDESRDAIGAMLRLRGQSANTVDPAVLAGARVDCQAAKANLRGYKSAPVKADLIAGDVWIAQLWNGDTRQAATDDPRIRFALPTEGSTIWLDSLVMPVRAPHPRAAHAFLDYMLRPEVAAQVASWAGYGTPNRTAQGLMASPVPSPTPEELARLEFQADLGRATERWDRIWTEIKAG
jgi:spermidine/putrescine-binding protein